MNATRTTTVRYDGDVPKTLRAYADKNFKKIYEINGGDGYNTNSGFAYDVLLRPGWRDGGDYCHTLIEQNVAEILAKLRATVPCDCDECKAALLRQQVTGASVTYWS